MSGTDPPGSLGPHRRLDAGSRLKDDPVENGNPDRSPFRLLRTGTVPIPVGPAGGLANARGGPAAGGGSTRPRPPPPAAAAPHPPPTPGVPRPPPPPAAGRPFPLPHAAPRAPA